MSYHSSQQATQGLLHDLAMASSDDAQIAEGGAPPQGLPIHLDEPFHPLLPQTG